MTNFDSDEITVAEQLRTAELYVQTQSDKFHPLSDSLLEIFEGTGSEEATQAAVLEELVRYEENADPKKLKYHSYHIGRIREMFTAEYYS